VCFAVCYLCLINTSLVINAHVNLGAVNIFQSAGEVCSYPLSCVPLYVEGIL
jgi:hypothetical protein